MIAFVGVDSTGHGPPDSEQVRLLGVSVVCLSDDLQRMENAVRLMVFPVGFEPGDAATRIHGLTTERLLDQGLRIDVVLGLVNQLVSKATRVVSFNAAYAHALLWAEQQRLSKISRWPDDRTVCAMQMLSRRLRSDLPDNVFLSLQEAAALLFPCSTDEAEAGGSWTKVWLLVRIMRTMQARGFAPHLWPCTKMNWRPPFAVAA